MLLSVDKPAVSDSVFGNAVQLSTAQCPLTLSLVDPPVSLYQLLTNGAAATFLKKNFFGRT